MAGGTQQPHGIASPDCIGIAMTEHDKAQQATHVSPLRICRFAYASGTVLFTGVCLSADFATKA
jgi:hypothetical protein